MRQESSSLCDQSVFEKVYRLYADALYRFLTYSFQNNILAEDITQNVFLKLWDQCDAYHLTNIKSLIFTMGKNLSLNELKKQGLQTAAPAEEISFSASPEEELEGKEFQEKLVRAINALSENERVVFLMNRMDQLTYREIAERLDISQKAVEKRMHLALKKLQEMLAVDLKRKKG